MRSPSSAEIEKCYPWRFSVFAYCFARYRLNRCRPSPEVILMASRFRRLSRCLAVTISALLLWPQIITTSFAFIQQGNGQPQPRRRANWPGRRPNLNVERNRPAHLPQQHEPETSSSRSPRMPLQARGWRRVGDPLPTPSANSSPTPRVSPAPTVTPGSGVAVKTPRAATWADGYMWGGA